MGAGLRNGTVSRARASCSYSQTDFWHETCIEARARETMPVRRTDMTFFVKSCPDVQMFIFSDVQMSSCPDVKMTRCPDDGRPACTLSIYRDVQMSRCPDVEMPRCPDDGRSRCQDVQMSRCRDDGQPVDDGKMSR